MVDAVVFGRLESQVKTLVTSLTPGGSFVNVSKPSQVSGKPSPTPQKMLVNK